ncbi:MAG: hypothetical protein ABEJ26_13420 [Halosimplex sp.]
MIADALSLALGPAYLLLLALVGLRYRRGEIGGGKLRFYVGSSLTWLAYGLVQLTREGPIPTGTTLNDGLGGLSLLCLVAGVYLTYRGWRDGDEGSKADGSST